VLQGDAKALRGLIEEIGFPSQPDKKRAQKVVNVLLGEVQKSIASKEHPEQWCHQSQRLGISGNRKNLPFFEGKTWLPQSLREDNVHSEDLDGLGSIFYCMQAPRTVRCGQDQCFFNLMGRFFLGTCQCTMVVWAWDVATAFNEGMTSWTELKFLDAMKEEAFNQWVQKNVKHCVLEPGGAIWIPYGFSHMCISLPPEFHGATAESDLPKYCLKEMLRGKFTEINSPVDEHIRDVLEDNADGNKWVWNHYLTVPVINKKLLGNVDIETRKKIQRILFFINQCESVNIQRKYWSLVCLFA